jgi:hypothetical protein
MVVGTHASALLFNGSGLELVILDDEVLPHLRERLTGDRLNAQILLGLCEIQPQLSPGGMPGALAERLLHLIAGVARVERRLAELKTWRRYFLQRLQQVDDD